MSQLAIWEQSSWSYRSVKNSNNIDSRTNPLVVLSNAAEFVVVSGGLVDGRTADPNLVVLDISDGSWEWLQPTVEGGFPASLLGAAMLPGDILFAITNSTYSEVVLLNTTSWKYLSSYSKSSLKAGLAIDSAAAASATATATVAQSHSNLSGGSIAAISTLSVVAAAVIAYLIYSYIYKRRRMRRPLGPLTPNSDQGIFLPSSFDEKPLEDDDNESVTTWEEKRKTWIKKYSGVAFGDDPIVAGVNAMAGTSEQDPASATGPMMMHIPSPTATPFGETATDRLNRRPIRLANERSMDRSLGNELTESTTETESNRSASPTIFGLGKKGFRSLRKSTRSISSGASASSVGASITGSLSRGFRRRVSGGPQNTGLSILEGRGSIQQTDNSSDIKPADDDDDLYELFKDREVQVLVSTTRKGALRITNPDEDQEQVPASSSTSRPLPPVPPVPPVPVARLNSTSSRTRWLTGSNNLGYREI